MSNSLSTLPSINSNSQIIEKIAAFGDLISDFNSLLTTGIVFIDPNIDDYETLLAGVKPGLEVVLLDGNRDGITQITEVLQKHRGLLSLHIVAHGEVGGLWLGSGFFSSDTFDQYINDVASWRTALAPDGDILLYGCNVAAGETGREFVQRLSELTGAAVAASSNLTGSAELGSDWDLEVMVGDVEAPLAFRVEVIESYGGVLATFGSPNNFPGGVQPQYVSMADLNGDGNLDLVVPNRATNNVSIFLGDGTGNFGTATNYQVGTYGFASVVGDFNGDIIPDIAVANWGSSNVSVLLGTGTGTFNPATNFAVGSSPWSVAMGDFNGDGKLDLATANISSNNVSILLGTGTGSFNPATNFSVGNRPQSVAVGDFNNDGKLDLATANFNSNNVSIILGTGTGSFGSPTNINVGTNPYSVAVGDLNGDGKLDLATANEGSSNVSVLLGTGTGSFNPATNFSVGSGPRSVAIADIDGDGKLDLVTANGVGSNSPSNNISILAGTGTGSFAAATNLNLGTGPWTVAVGDLNNDGKPDLATSNYWTNNVSVLLNTTISSTPVVNFDAPTYSGTEETTDNIINIPVTLSATPLTDVTVPIVINPSSTASLGSDYTLFSTTVTFLAGATGTALTQNVAVTIKPDNIAENAETVVLNLGTITGANAGTTNQTTLTIAPNDPISYSITTSNSAIAEGNSGTTPLTFTVTRSGGVDAASSVNYTIGGTATNGTDYNNIGGTSGATGTTGTINFAAGEISRIITMNVLGDTVIEPNETIAVTLSNPVVPGPTPTINTAVATTTIINDDVETPGDTLATARNSGLSSANPGTFNLNAQIGDNPNVGTNSDVDMIAFQLDAGGRVTIDVDANANGSPLDSVVRIFNSTGQALAYSDDTPAPGESSSLDPYLSFTATQAGTYYVGVSGYGNSSYNPNVAGSGSSFQTGNYNLQMTVASPLPPETPGDTLATARNSGLSSVNPGTFNLNAQIGDNPNVGTNSDVDMIAFQLDAGGRVTIDVDANANSSPLDSVMRIFNSTGQALAYSDDTPAPGESFSLDPYLSFTATQAGTYYVGVSGYGNSSYNPNVAGSGSSSQRGNYNLQMSVNSSIILGTEAIDTLIGTSNSDTIYGLGGNDTIYANNGNNAVYGGAGNDHLYADNGNDLMNGDDGDDTIYANEGNNTVYGGAGNDTLYANNGNDIMDGSDGNDTIYANQGNNTVNGGAGNDLIYTGSGNDIINGGDGNDTIYANAGDDILNGGLGDDILWLGGGRDTVTLESGDGFDTINGFQLNQTTFHLGAGLSASNLTIFNSANGAEIYAGSDRLAVISWTQASVIQNNLSTIFI